MHEDTGSLLPLGARVDAYEIVGHLGRGGFGITYKIFDPGLRKELALKEFFPADLVAREGRALKILAKGRAESDYQWARRKFFDEARLLARLSHPNIVKVQRVFEANNTVYMLLDFIPGSTLEAWLSSIAGRPTQEEMDLIARPLLSALEVAHASGTCHLDVAPDNILVRSSDGAPILLDFGAARLEIKQRSRLVSAMLFKSGYSAPEQYTSSADRYGPWTDIYAMGATLYRAIAGKRPQESTMRMLKDDLAPAVQIGKGHYRESFLRSIDNALRLPLSARPQSIATWRRELLPTAAPATRLNPVITTPAAPDRAVGGIARLAALASPLLNSSLAARINTVAAAAMREADRWIARTPLTRRQALAFSGTVLFGLLCVAVGAVAPNLLLDAGKAVPSVEAKADRAPLIVPPPVVEQQAQVSSRAGTFVKVFVKLGAITAVPGKGWLGARAGSITTEMARSFGLLTTRAAFIEDVAPDGSFGAAGGRAGDIVFKVDGRDIAGVADLRNEVQSRVPGDSLTFDVWCFGTDSQSFKDVLHELAGRGDGYAMNWLGIYHKGSTLFSRNDGEAVAWFRKGAEAGDADATFGLGSMIADGQGVRKNLAEAQRVLLAAGKLGNIDAFIRLAQVLVQMRRSASEARRQAGTLQIGADNGNVSAMMTLGDWYTNGYGVARNYAEAMRLYKRAAELGAAAGNTSLGVLHLGGMGVIRNDAQAAEYGRLGASQGDLAALRLIGYLYENGLGVERRDPDLAADLVFQAIASGHEPSFNDMSQATQKASLEFRVGVQRRLREAGLYSGETDGIFSQPTLAALRTLYERRSRVAANL